MYRCLVCDIPLTVGMFERHAAWHGWDLENMRQIGFEREAARLVTHEFGERGGASLFWLIRHLNPLQPEEDY